jgi:hypothetical protein
MPDSPAFIQTDTLPVFSGGGKEYTLHVDTSGGGKGYTLHVYTDAGGNVYTQHVHSAGAGKEYILVLHSAYFWQKGVVVKVIHTVHP